MPKKPVRTEATQLTNLQRFNIANSAVHTRAKHDTISFSARNEKQKVYIKALKREKIVVGVGPSGCGKTYLATLMAANELVNEEINKIVIVRPSVPVDGENAIGSLPGDIIGKYGPQVKAITDTLVDYFGLQKLKSLLEAEVVEIVPVAFIRGRSLSNTRILVDEAQNLTASGMKAVLTRIGEGSKCFITGDISQSDRPTNNGLDDLLKRLDKKLIEDTAVIKFTVDEIEREPIIKPILELYDISV